MSATQLKVINAVAFQLCWFACVLGGSLWALPAVLAFMIWHRKVATKEEWLFISVLSLSGIALDTLWYQLGVFSFDNYTMPVIPAWLALLWLAFSATLLHSLHTIFLRVWLIVPLAAISAPVSYYAGQKFGALTLGPDALWIISASWGGLMLAAYFAHSSNIIPTFSSPTEREKP